MTVVPDNKCTDSPRTQAERTAQSDRAMIEAAIDLLLNHGTSRTTLAAIGEKAGYSRGLATYRFGSKAGLFDEICRTISRRWLGFLTAEVDQKIGGDAICAAADAYVKFVTQSPQDARVLQLLYGEATHPDGETRTTALDTYRRQHRDVVEWVEQGIRTGEVREDANAELVAIRFISYIAGITHLWLIMPDMVNLQAANDDYKQQLRADLSPESGAACTSTNIQPRKIQHD